MITVTGGYKIDNTNHIVLTTLDQKEIVFVIKKDDTVDNIISDMEAHAIKIKNIKLLRFTLSLLIKQRFIKVF